MENTVTYSSIRMFPANDATEQNASLGLTAPTEQNALLGPTAQSPTGAVQAKRKHVV